MKWSKIAWDETAKQMCIAISGDAKIVVFAARSRPEDERECVGRVVEGAVTTKARD